MSSKDFILLYDRQCPICESYWKKVKIDESVGTLKLLDARNNPDLVTKMSRLGYNIDQGNILIVNNTIFFANEAITAISLISSRSDLFNRFNFWIFRSNTFSKLIYPLFRLSRALLLRILSKKKINQHNR